MSAKTLFSKFTSLTDNRDPKKSTHILAEVMFMSVCAILCGADYLLAVKGNQKTLAG
ncbi:transposase family protein [Endozoicomonas euniceicola]|uniref:Transposase family protein n=1 Tax=Endozoicomonas euniceicola TaxID=1234143 RepID=A0ABY6GSD5_9GAMM|nr:transposase family protein [Endozoicomonas euniceicola]UYM15041.1 transposase family protein [Endozoicomonas euniceicola]